MECVFQLPQRRALSREFPREGQPPARRHDNGRNPIANGDLENAPVIFQLVDGNRGFALAADVYKCDLRANRDNRPLDGLAFLNALRFDRSLKQCGEVIRGLIHGAVGIIRRAYGLAGCRAAPRIWLNTGMSSAFAGAWLLNVRMWA